MNMSSDPCPKVISPTVEDFVGSGWKEVLASTGCKGYRSMHSAFNDAAKAAIDEGRKAQGKILSLLAGACSMALSPNSVNEPFKPLWQSNGQRSILPEDLSDTDVTFFAHIVDNIDDPWLKARLADLVWLVKRPREVEFALAAIDSYLSIPFDTGLWGHGLLECWKRAICLIRQLGAGAGDRLVKVEVSLLEKFQTATSTDGFLCLKLSNLFKENDLGKKHALEIARKLESIALESNSGIRLDIAREYFRASSVWFKTAKEDAKSIEMKVAEAENWVTQATNRISSAEPSHMVAASCYEQAIQVYRTVPRAMRSEYHVDERIADLQQRLNEAGQKSLDEMGVISTPVTDISELVKNVRDAVRGKTLPEALRTFANLPCSVKTEELRESAIERLNAFPLQAFISATVMNHDGRVIAKRPGMSTNATLSDNDNTCENEMVIHSTMVQDYSYHVGLAVQGYIRPAHDILLLEHRIRETDFITLASQSPIVPVGRETLFGKALFAGYDHDFITALHLLVPQIEHMVRFHLKQAQVKTTNLDSNGIETENSLNTLMELSETQEIFGENLCFEIKALFCDPFGANLRNELAHGLLGDDECQSDYAIYAWWLGMKLVFNTFWNHLHNYAENEE